MKDEIDPLFLKTLILIAKLDDEFLELASHLQQVKQTNPNDFKKLYSMPQLGRRKAYYLASIDKAFGDKNVPTERLKKIGWTKLAALAPIITDENLEDALLFAELNTAKNIEAVVHGLEPIVGGRSVLLIFNQGRAVRGLLGGNHGARGDPERQGFHWQGGRPDYGAG